ncbi:MAG TPA: HIT domain-containing protein [Spirochaetia bacterium]|nr:HIT domain-containing protein [Spirochaetia bacterium]
MPEGGYFFNFDKLAYVRGRHPAGCILCLARDGSPDVVDLSIWRDDLFVASVNLYPYNPGHLLVYPQRHVEDIRELTAEEERRMAGIQRWLLDLLDRACAPHAYNIGFNMGAAAGASINHLHLHIIPRYPKETGIADLIAGRRVLVEDPRETARQLREMAAREPYSSRPT